MENAKILKLTNGKVAQTTKLDRPLNHTQTQEQAKFIHMHCTVHIQQARFFSRVLGLIIKK